jgi:hypothetical membrane protein
MGYISQIMMANWFFWIGLIACVWILVGMGFSLVDFKGMKKEPYSIWNHFISELGDPRFAPHYRLFNLTLIIGGLLLIPFIVGWGLVLDSIIGNISIGMGICVAILCSLIGIFPEHKEKEHFNIAGLFFLGMTILILLVGIALIYAEQTHFPKWVFFINLIPCICSAIFIIDTFRLPKWEYLRTYRPWEWDPERPKFWRNPFLEWVAFLSMMGWLGFITLFGIMI